MTEQLPTPDRSGSALPFRLGACLVHPSLQWVERDGERVRLEPKAMQTLTLLAERPGEVFTRGELLETVWAETIVGDETLSRIISLLRQVLGDDSRNPRYIETIYKKGYRLLVAPEPTGVEDAAAAAESAATDAPAARRTSPAPARRRRRTAAATAVIIALAVVATLIAANRHGRQPASEPTPAREAGAPRQVPVTAFPGSEFAPAFAADGLQVAFCRETEPGAAAQIWIRAVAGGAPRQITDGPGSAYLVAFAPDGRRLAYAVDAERHEIRVRDLQSGQDRPLHAADRAFAGLDWSPDGTRLAVASFGRDDIDYRIRLLDAEDGTVSSPGPAPDARGRETLPAFSPDGTRLAFTRSSAGVARLHVVELDGGSVRILGDGFGRVTGLDWLPDGRSLVVTHMPGDFGILQRIDLESGAVTDIPNHSASASAPTVAPDSGRLVFVDGAERLGIWTIDERSGRPVPAPGLNSTRLDGAPTWSHDGRRLALVSTRSGRPEVWLRDGADQPLRRITHFEGPEVTAPRWSYDGRRLAVTPHDGSRFYVEIIEPDGTTRRLDDGEHNQVAQGWSRDSQWLYVLRDRSGSAQTWRMRPDGTDAAPTGTGDSRILGELPGGRELLLLSPTSHELRARDLATGAERRLLDAAVTSGWRGMRLQGDRVLFVEPGNDQTRLGRLDPADGAIEDLARFPGRNVLFFSCRPDGSGILFEREERGETDLVMLEWVD